MKNNRIMIVSFTIISIICYFIYQEIKIPPNITPMGDTTNNAEWMVYWGGMSALGAALIGVIREIIGLIRDIRKNND